MIKNKSDYNEYMKSYMLARYHTRRNEAILKFGGKCVKCGSIECLEFDHINPEDKLFTIGKMWSLNNTAYLTELNKCQLLCESCHLEKTKADGVLQNKAKTTVCDCGKVFHTTKQYAGHRTWCKVSGR